MKLKLEFDSFQDFASRLWPCLSEEGMWVPSEQPAPVGDLVEFEVALADGFRLFHGAGQVISVGAGPEAGPGGEGMAIRFSKLDQPSRNLVRKVISKHTSEGGRPFTLSSLAAEDGGAGDRLPEPFPDLGSDVDWESGEGPELRSFLQTGDAPREAPPERISAEGAGFEVGDESGAATPSEEAEEKEEESARSFGEARAEFEAHLAETQQVEPLEPEGDPTLPFDQPTEVEPRPSTAFPPGTPGRPAGGEPLDEEPPPDDAPVAGARGGWWAWALVAVAAVIAGLWVASLFDTPVARWLAGETAPQTAAATPSRTAGRTDEEATAAAPPAEVAPPEAAPVERREDVGQGGVETATEDPATADEPVEAAPPVPAPTEVPAIAPPEPDDSPTEAAPAPVSSLDGLGLERITWREDGGDTVVRLWLDGRATAERLETLRVRTGAPRLVLKLRGFDGAAPSGPVPIGSAHVERLRFGVHPGATLHVVADLSAEEVELVGAPAIDGEGLELRFERP